MRTAQYSEFELRQIVTRRRQELTRRDAELAKPRQIAQERARIAAELAELDTADRLLND